MLCGPRKKPKDRGVDFCGHEKEIKTRAQARLDFWANHLKKPSAALAKTLEGLEQGASVPFVASEW